MLRLYLTGNPQNSGLNQMRCERRASCRVFELFERLIPQRNVLSKPRAPQEEKRVASTLFDVLRIVTTLYGDAGDINNWSETWRSLMAARSPCEESSWESVQRLMLRGLISDADVSGEIFVRESFELFVYDGMVRSV